MKKLKMAFMAVSALTSVGSAFAFSPAAKPNAQTYYAVRTAAGFNWQTAKPVNKSCSDTQITAICTIVTSTPPANNLVPAGHTGDMTVYE
ncbi:hypothetical protein [Mucilaginibacter phyllosphaerae]